MGLSLQLDAGLATQCHGTATIISKQLFLRHELPALSFLVIYIVFLYEASLIVRLLTLMVLTPKKAMVT